MTRRLALFALALLAAAQLSASAQIISGGRVVDPNKDFSVSLKLGQITDIKGSVTETSRQLYDILDMPEKQLTASSYDLNDLGIKNSDMMYGVEMEKMWRFVTLRGSLSYFTASAEGVAKRDYFISVDDISYNGKKYDHMKIEDGERYEASLDAALLHLRAQITPFTIAPENIVSFTPFLHLGIFGMYGAFEVDSGEAKGTQWYQNPPYEFVVGGHGEGDSGVFAPEIGLGGELRIYLGQTENGLIELAIEGTYAIFQFNGSSGSLGISSKNDKELDVDYDMAELRATLNYPLNKEVDLIFGFEGRRITAEGSSKAKDRGVEDALVRREKFDKEISLEMTMISGFLGLRW